MISEVEFKEWLEHPVTIEVRKVLAAKRADLRNEWEMSDPTAFSDTQFTLGNAANVGWCRGLAFAETINHEVYITELELGDDGKQKRARTPRSSGPDQNV